MLDSIKKRNLFAFLIGLFSITTIRIVAVFTITEIILTLFLPYFLFKKESSITLRSKKTKTVLVLLSLWIIGAFISDILNQGSMFHFLKGSIRLIPWLGCFIFAFWFLKREYISLFKYFAVGTLFSFVLDVYIFQYITFDFYEITGRIVFYIISQLAILLSLFYFRNYPRASIIMIMLVGVSQLFAGEGNRSTFLLLFMSAFIVLVIMYYTRFNFNGELMSRAFRKNVFLIIGILIIASLGSKKIYESLVMNDFLSKKAKEKFEMQSNSEIGLLSGRGEFISAALAIYDAPFFGHGSWALDTKNYGIKAAQIAGLPKKERDMLKSVYKRRNAAGKTPLIPCHSHLTSAWVYHGILGALFWFYIFYLLMIFLIKYLFVKPALILYMIITALGQIWMLWFSPIQGTVIWAFYIALIIRIMDEKDMSDRIKQINKI